MSTLLNKGYLVKVSTKGGGGSKMPQILSTWFVQLYTPPPIHEFSNPSIFVKNPDFSIPCCNCHFTENSVK